MNLFDLIRRPHAFFEALHQFPPAPWRSAWLPAVAGLLGGVSQAFLARPVLDSFSLALPMLPAALTWTVTILAGVVGSVLLWLVLWGMGQLGAGREARSAEVYGATFLAPLLWAAVLLVLALVTPTQLKVTAPSFDGLDLNARLSALQTYSVALSTQLATLPLARFNSLMGYAIYIVQFWLAYIGFRVMTASSAEPSTTATPTPGVSTSGASARAWKGVLYPGGLLLVLGLVGLLLASASLSLAGAAV